MTHQELLYDLSGGDICKAGSVALLPAVEAYRWLLLAAKVRQSVQDRISENDDQQF